MPRDARRRELFEILNTLRIDITALEGADHRAPTRALGMIPSAEEERHH